MVLSSWVQKTGLKDDDSELTSVKRRPPGTTLMLCQVHFYENTGDVCRAYLQMGVGIATVIVFPSGPFINIL